MIGILCTHISTQKDTCATITSIPEYYTTLEPLIKDTLNTGHNTFNLFIKDKFFSPYRTMAIHSRTTSV